jgi:hypothetical protein
MCLPAEVLLIEALLVGVLPLVVLLAAEKGMVLAVSVFLETRERILPELEILEEEVLLLSGASFVLWYSWYLFFSVDWTRGHQHFYFWSLPMRWCADTEREIRKCKCNRYKSEFGMKNLKMYLERLCQGRGSYR